MASAEPVDVSEEQEGRGSTENHTGSTAGLTHDAHVSRMVMNQEETAEMRAQGLPTDVKIDYNIILVYVLYLFYL